MSGQIQCVFACAVQPVMRIPVGRRMVPGTKDAKIKQLAGRKQWVGGVIEFPSRSLNSGFPTPPALSFRVAYIISMVLERIIAPPYMPIPRGM